VTRTQFRAKTIPTDLKYKHFFTIVSKSEVKTHFGRRIDDVLTHYLNSGRNFEQKKLLHRLCSTFRHALANFPKHFPSGESLPPFWSAFHLDRPSLPWFWPSLLHMYTSGNSIYHNATRLWRHCISHLIYPTTNNSMIVTAVFMKEDEEEEFNTKIQV